MDLLVEIAFKGNRKEFFRWAGDEPLADKARVIVEADRGEDLGVVHSTGDRALLRNSRLAHGTGDTPPAHAVLRLASAQDVAEEALLREQEDELARQRARELVQQHGLLMKVTDAEWQFDRMKLTLYFTAEKRVDFRALVRDLAATFRTRIELKQIGVRDEAKRLSGIGRCGREYCSASWLPELLPINLGIAKDQKLSLNPTQISGACGRLMCCLRFEHDFYVQSRKRFPKEGRILVTSVGEEKVMANDIFRESVRLRNVEGDVRDIPLQQLKRELASPDGSPSIGHAQVLLGAAGSDSDRELRVLREARGAGSSGADEPNGDVSETNAAGSAPAAPGSMETREAPAQGGAPDVTSAAALPHNDSTDQSGAAESSGGGADEQEAEGQNQDQGVNSGSRKRHRRGRRGGRRSRGHGNHGTGTDSTRDGESPDESPSGSRNNPSDR